MDGSYSLLEHLNLLSQEHLEKPLLGNQIFKGEGLLHPAKEHGFEAGSNILWRKKTRWAGPAFASRRKTGPQSGRISRRESGPRKQRSTEEVIKNSGANGILRRKSKPHESSREEKYDLEITGALERESALEGERYFFGRKGLWNQRHPWERKHDRKGTSIRESEPQGARNV